MSPTHEHLAIAFVNTLSSPARDRIATPERFSGWAGAWPSLAPLAVKLPASALSAIRNQRDATQQVLRRLTHRESVAPEVLEVATRPGLTAAPFRLVAEVGHIQVEGNPEAGIRYLLSSAVIELVLSPQISQLRRCAGVGCRKVFLTQRSDRRWCDSRTCGNRTRVAAHARRRAESPAPRP